MDRTTIFSPCRAYRYSLWRSWSLNDAGDIREPTAFVQFVGLNPSTADEVKDDNTVRRCITFARLWGYSHMCMTNLFAFRATNPDVMMAAEEPVGVENNDWICRIAREATLIIACWGNGGQHRSRHRDVLDRLRAAGVRHLNHFGMTKQGLPRHPLYLAKLIVPTPWEI